MMIRGQDETRGRIERERVVRLATILAGFYDEDWPKVWRFRLRGTGRRESGAHAMVRDVR
jgi:hypothetical protein